MDDKIEIPLSKRKLILALIGSLLFVIVGCLATVKPEYFVSPIFRNYEVVRIIGVSSFIFFGFCLLFIARKLFDNKPGLIIDQKGITDNSNVLGIVFIEWQDITGIEIRQVASTKILLVRTNKPEKYIERAKSYISKKAMLANQRAYGSPISITSKSLKIRFNDLEALIMREFKRIK